MNIFRPFFIYFLFYSSIVLAEPPVINIGAYKFAISPDYTVSSTYFTSYNLYDSDGKYVFNVSLEAIDQHWREYQSQNQNSFIELIKKLSSLRCYADSDEGVRFCENIKLIRHTMINDIDHYVLEMTVVDENYETGQKSFLDMLVISYSKVGSNEVVTLFPNPDNFQRRSCDELLSILTLK